MPSSLLMVLLAVFAPLGAHTGRVSLRGKRLFVDGAPFFIQGVAYSPVPLGDDPLYGAPYGDYFTDEYEAYWVRDMPLLANMGANAVRTYSWNRTRDHTAFLDMAHKHGVMVVATYFLGSTQQTPVYSAQDLANVTRSFAKQVGKYRDHPALLGWSFGNEINGIWNGFPAAISGVYGCGWNPGTFPLGCGGFDMKNRSHPCFKATNCMYRNLFRWVGDASRAAHEALGEDNQQLIFTTFADVDLLAQRIADYEAELGETDIIAAQLYRGRDFGTGDNDFLAQVNRATKRPLAITEYGIDAYRDSCGICTEQRCETPCYNSFSNESKGFGEDEMTQAEWLSELAGTLLRSHDQGGGVVGGFAMAWTDEAWKTTTHYPTSICSDNALKSKNGGWEFHYPHKKFRPETCGFKAHVDCPNLDIWRPSLCGQYLPAFPDHYLNEGFFGINRVVGVEGTSVNQLEQRIAYLELQRLWVPKSEPAVDPRTAWIATAALTLAVVVSSAAWAWLRARRKTKRKAAKPEK